MYADRREPAASTSSTSPRRRARARRHEDDRADVGAAEDRPGERVPRGRAPARGRDRAVPLLPGLARAGRRGARRCRARAPLCPAPPWWPWRTDDAPRRADCAPRSCATRSTAGRHVEVSDRRQREDREQHQRRMNRREQGDRHAEPQDPAGGREDRHVHVVEDEDLVAQHREPIEIVGALVVRDGRDRGEQPRDVRFQGDRHLVAEPALEAGADGAEEPGGRRRRGRGRSPRRRAGAAAVRAGPGRAA